MSTPSSPDPGGKMPGAVRFDTMSPGALGGIFGGIFLALVAVSAVFFYGCYDRVGKAEGMTAVAQARVVTIHHDGNNRVSNPVYRWTYKGRSFTREGIDHPGSLSPGDRTSVRFNPGDPEFVVKQGSWAQWTGPAGLAFGGLLFAFFAFLVIVMFTNARRLRAQQIAWSRAQAKPPAPGSEPG